MSKHIYILLSVGLISSCLQIIPIKTRQNEEAIYFDVNTAVECAAVFNIDVGDVNTV